MTLFNSILIANRGEIAVRINKTAKKLGYRTIAVYSAADHESQHVKDADESYSLGPDQLADSYLNHNKIIEIAKRAQAGAIHPGYGFLSENHEFMAACTDAGLVFIGPNKENIALMGNKAAAKRHMEKNGVPCIPGYQGEDQSDQKLTAEADKIGYPILIKASAGGGGKGMRMVTDPAELKHSLSLARSEALSAFGIDELILEKVISKPRHVEIQVFADMHGNVIHMGERDCSIQRRFQKIIEEGPCLSEALRESLGATAVKAAKSIGYLGAGTVEFLLEDSNFYFMEMNTRLQVEHAVTELITGIDLVALQIQVATGTPLGLSQKDINFNGHAFEARLYAEDPSNQFMPATGKIELWSPTTSTRVDTAINTGDTITPFYDPMIAKFIAWGENRTEARKLLIHALKESILFGVKTNKSFLLAALTKKSLIAGPVSTDFVSQELSDHELTSSSLHMMIAATLQYVCEREAYYQQALLVANNLKNWSSGPQITKSYHYTEKVFVTGKSNDYHVRIAEHEKNITILEHTDQKAMLEIDGKKYFAVYHSNDLGHFYLSIDGREEYYRNQLSTKSSHNQTEGNGQILSPMHGILCDILVKPGQAVEKGTCLAIVEAMKMQNEVRSGVTGTVDQIHCEKGLQIKTDQLIMDIKVKEN